jgi:hypothetical protein
VPAGKTGQAIVDELAGELGWTVTNCKTDVLICRDGTLSESNQQKLDTPCVTGCDSSSVNVAAMVNTFLKIFDLSIVFVRNFKAYTQARYGEHLTCRPSAS